MESLGKRFEFLYKEFKEVAAMIGDYPDEMDIRKYINVVDPLSIIENNPGVFKEFVGKDAAEMLKKNAKNPAFMKIFNELVVSNTN